MQKKYSIVILAASFFALISSSFSSDIDFKLNPIVMKNRAQCALDSKLPARSVFLIADGYNPGRLAHNFAKTTTLDSQKLAIEAMQVYMKSIGQLQNLITQRLLQGRLPLLSSDLGALSKFQEAAKACGNQVYCPQLNMYIESLWKESSSESPTFQKHDTFSSQHIVQKSIEHGCYYLKEFSPLQSHLYGTEVDREQLRSLGHALSSENTSLVECTSDASSIKPDHFSIQIDILANTNEWHSIGHAFWYSLKIYTSWAFRYSKDAQAYFGKFKKIFNNLDLEESLLYVSNGCESVTKPQCDSENLTLNSLRELAKIQVQTNEFDSQIPAGPHVELLKKGARDVNNDFLSLLDHNTANEWVENFKDNFTSQQWIYRNKILNAHQSISFLAANKTPSFIASDIAEFAKQADTYPSIKTEMLYLCTEWSLSSNRDFDFILSDIERVSQLSFMQGLSIQHGLSIPEQIEYFLELGKALKPVCSSLHQEKYFDQDEKSINWSGLNPWAKELAARILEQPDPNKLPFEPALINNQAYLVLPNSETVLCMNAADCARSVIKSAIDLYSVSTYARAFINKGTIDSSEMLNPYNELAACEVYDPWFQKKRTRKRLVADLANVALFGWNNIPAYIDVDFSPNRVTSFKQLVEEGTVKFHPEMIKAQTHYSFLADLGPLAGAPCAIAVSPNSDKAFNFYAFGGISVNACKVTSERKVSYKGARNPVVNDPNDRSFCGGCTINFVGVSSSYSNRTYQSGFNPLKAGVYIFRAFYRFFKGIKDPVNVPRTQTLNLSYIQETFDLYGDIPENCVKPLSKGQRCTSKFCESSASILFEKTTNRTPKKVRLGRAHTQFGKYAQKATVIDEDCRQKHELIFTCNEATKDFGFIQIKSDSNRRCKSKGVSFL